MLEGQAPDDQRQNGLVIMETAASVETDSDAPNFRKPSPDASRGYVSPSPAVDGVVLNVCVDQKDVSTHGTPVMRNSSRTPSPRSETPRPHTPGSTAPATDPRGDRPEPGYAASEALLDGEFRVYVNEINVSTEPETSRINRFR